MDSYTVSVPMLDQGPRKTRMPGEPKPPVRMWSITIYDKPEMERMVRAYRAIGVEPVVTTSVEQTVEVPK